MKKIFYLIAIFFMAIAAQAQYDPEALSVLDAMSAKYKKMSGFTVNFTQQMTNENAGIDESIKGNITLKGNKYLLKVASQEIYNNGTDTYTYNPENKEVTINKYEPEEEEITPGNIYELYKKGFKYNLMGVNNAGDRTIELDPEDKNKSYYKIRLIIDKTDNLKKFTVFERAGNKYIYSIDSFAEKSLPDSYFTFDVKKHPDVEVIDFR